MPDTACPVARTLHLPPDLARLAEGRRFAAEAAAVAGFTEARSFDIMVATSEAIANAIEHSLVKADIHVSTVVSPDRLEITVEGPGEFRAPDRPPSRLHRGLGLPLMAKLADHLTLCSGPLGGTIVGLTFYSDEARSSYRQPPPLAAARPGPPHAARITTGDFGDEIRRNDLNHALSLLNEAQRIAHLGNWEVDPATKSARVSAELARIVGLPADAPLPTTLAGLSRLFAPAEWTRIEAAMQRMLHTGDPLELDVSLNRGNGSESWVCVRGELARDDPDGRALVRGTVQDITERKRREKNLAILGEIGEDLSRLSTCRQIMTAIGERLHAHLGATGCTLSQIEQAADLMIDQHAWTCHDGVGGSTAHRLSRRVTRKFVRKALARKTIVIGDCAGDGRVQPSWCAASGVASLVAVPLQRDSHWRYLFSVDDAFVRLWREDEIELIEQVAERIVPALERAQAEEALRRSEEKFRLLAAENERLYRQQLDIAESLQLTLLNVPSEIGRLKLGHLYRSASEAARVGGDFYDVFDVKDGNVAVLIGDVAGHGIQAARTATLVKDVVHAFTHGSIRPYEVLRRTNELLIEKALPGFVSVFLGILDSDGGRLRYSSAGHPAAFLRHTDGDIATLGWGSHPLGVYVDSSWRSAEVELTPGDVLLLYTDGVTEARRGDEFFGEERLKRLLRRKRTSVFRLPHLILEQVLAFSDGALKDDVAILALSLTDS